MKTMHETCVGAYKEYVGIFKQMDLHDYAGDGEADARRIVELEAVIASLPATTPAEQHMKIVAAKLAGLDTEGGAAIVESLERDLETYGIDTLDSGRASEMPYH
jgi:hypothetical protein